MLVLGLEVLSSFQYLCSFPCMHELSYVYISFNWCQTNRSKIVLHTGNSLAGNPCVFASVYLSSMYSFVYSLFQVLLISFFMFTSSFHTFCFQELGENPLEI